MSREVLRVENLDVILGEKRVLKRVSFSVEKGEVVSILGPNGSGKTTLLRCLGGLLDSYKGEIQIDGVDIKKMRRKELAKRVSFLPQEPSINFPFSVFEVVLMGRNPHIGTFRTPSDEDKRKATRAMEIVGISDLRDAPFSRLSGGQRKMVLIARTLAQEADILLLDEPTNHLDFRNQFLILDKMLRITKNTSSLCILTLHDPNLALNFTKKTLLLNNGAILKYGNPCNVINAKNLDILYGIETESVDIGDSRKIILPRAI